MRTIIALCLAAAALSADEFTSDGVKIHYVVAGKGEAVVLIHGFGGNARNNWQLPGTFDLLAKDHLVVALDCRGHGESDKPEGQESYGEKMVEDVVRLMDHLKVEKAHVVGYSMGGILSMALLARHPECVLSVVLGGWGWMKKGGVLEKTFEMMPDRGAMAPEGCFGSLGSLGLTEEEVKAIRVPVTVIVGDRDPCRRLYVEPLHALRSDFDVHVIDRAGHINCLMKEEFKSELLAALGRHAGKGK